MKKCLIFGSTGWIGKNLVSYLSKKDENYDLILVSKTRKKLLIHNKIYKIHPIEDFIKFKDMDIDYFFNLSFLTGSNVNELNEAKFYEETDVLIDSVNKFHKNNNVKNALLSSSGAVYNKDTKKENVYSIQKFKQESEFIDSCISNNTNYLVSRIFAIFANYFDEVKYQYAFTSFLNSALNGELIEVASKKRVIRSYLFIDYLFEYFLLNESSKVIDVWNVEMDILDLANIISEIFNTKVNVSDEYLNSNLLDSYISKDKYFYNLYQDKWSTKKVIEKILEFSGNEDNKITIDLINQ